MDNITDKSKSSVIVDELIYFARTIVLLFIIVFIAMKFFFRPVQVSGESMYPTLKNAQYGFSNVFESLINHFERFDVVVVDPKEKALDPNVSNSLWIKRIIGLPGETIEYRNDKLYVNGKYIAEPFLSMEYVKKITYDGTLNFTNDFGPITLGENEYFVMGDNRGDSYDSRFCGSFMIEQFVSKSMIIVYPIDSIKIVN